MGLGQSALEDMGGLKMALTGTRDKSIDFVKGIAMIAVSFGHVMPGMLGRTDCVTQYCYSFELAAFFIASGYLQFGRAEREPLDYIKHSALSLLYPYVTFTAIIFVVESSLSVFENGASCYIQNLPIRICSVITWGAGACWFLPTFFASGIIAYF